jgi:hypothetical protein
MLPFAIVANSVAMCRKMGRQSSVSVHRRVVVEERDRRARLFMDFIGLVVPGASVVLA